MDTKNMCCHVKWMYSPCAYGNRLGHWPQNNHVKVKSAAEPYILTTLSEPQRVVLSNDITFKAVKIAVALQLPCKKSNFLPSGTHRRIYMLIRLTFKHLCWKKYCMKVSHVYSHFKARFLALLLKHVSSWFSWWANGKGMPFTWTPIVAVVPLLSRSSCQAAGVTGMINCSLWPAVPLTSFLPQPK